MTDEDERRSVAFDRAADYYDSTRVVGQDATRAQTELLVAELAGRGPTVEIGVGTGQVSLPLHAAGLPIVGLDLSWPMLGKLIDKAGGSPPFPLVRADATRLPFRDEVLGGVVVRWVLHLVPAWRVLVSEAVRVLRPGGVVLVNHGGFSGAGREIRERMQELVGRPLPPVGLDWSAWRELEAEMVRLGAGRRELPPLIEHADEPLAQSVRGIEANRYSWTWDLGEDERLRAVALLRPWLEERYGALDAPFPHETTTIWHAYDVP